MLHEMEDRDARRYQDDWDKAVANFTVAGEERSPDQSVQYVDASARTGSRYVVVLSRLGEQVRASYGANLLVSVLHPLQTAYAIYADGPDGLPGDDYLIEKFCRGLQHGGDHAALCLTIREAYRLMLEQPDPDAVRKLRDGRWEIEGYDVVQTGPAEYALWRDGSLVQEHLQDMGGVRRWIDAQRGRG